MRKKWAIVTLMVGGLVSLLAFLENVNKKYNVYGRTIWGGSSIVYKSDLLGRTLYSEFDVDRGIVTEPQFNNGDYQTASRYNLLGLERFEYSDGWGGPKDDGVVDRIQIYSLSGDGSYIELERKNDYHKYRSRFAKADKFFTQTKTELKPYLDGLPDSDEERLRKEFRPLTISTLEEKAVESEAR